MFCARTTALTSSSVVFLLVLLSCQGGDSVPMVENSVKFALERCRQFLHLATFLREDALNQDKDGIGKTKRICDHIVMLEQDFIDDDSKDNENEIPSIKTSKLSRKKKKSKKNNPIDDFDHRPDGDENEEDEEVVIVIKSIERQQQPGQKEIEKRIPYSSVSETITTTTTTEEPPAPEPETETETEETNFDSDEACMVMLYRKQNFQGNAITIRKSVSDTHGVAIKSLRVIGQCSWRFFNKSFFRGEHFTVGSGDSSRERASPSEWGWRAGAMRSMKRVKKRRRRKLEEF